MTKTPNEQQLAVINELEENILLFASAGTGKTFTVAQRVAQILAKGKAKASEILCLTFTIKASNEMREDIRSIVGETEGEFLVNTIHGFCYRLIVEECRRSGGNYGALSVCDEIDQEDILRNILSSRYHYWRLEDNLKSRGMPMPDLAKCEVGEVDGALVFKYDDCLITTKGTLIEGDFSQIEVVCPHCSHAQILTENRCIRCGEDITFHLEEKEFDIYRKKVGLRNLISEIKHCRIEGNFFTSDEVADNQAAYEYLKEEKRETFEGLLSYHSRYLGYAPDEALIAAMDAFAGRLTAEYGQHLLLSNLLDFDDLIMQAKAILEREEGLAYWQKRFSYIILDEMQDTSRLEFSLLRKLFSYSNVMLCGDFFQTIYGWRGSCPQEILEEYAKDFSAKIFMLSVNYRATKTLAKASFGYLRNTYPELIGKYCPRHLDIQSKREGKKIFCYAFDSREQEAEQIYKYLLRQKGNGSVCVLARTNKYIARLAAYFEKISAEREEEKRLRFFTVEENLQFFKKSLVKDVLALIKLLLNPLDRVSMERIAEKFVRQVGAKSLEYLRNQNAVGVSVCSFLEEQTYLYGDNYHHLLEGNIVVYDTETTGLNLQKDEPVQIAAIKLNKAGAIVDTLDILIEPTISIDEEATKTHGFTLEYIQAHGGISLEEGLRQFSEFTKGSVLVGHNNFGYDKPLIERLLHKYNLPPLEILAEYDTLPIAKQFYPQLANYKLETLCSHFSVMNECAHNAFEDIVATGKCLYKMIGEAILPTAMERQTILAKYASKFEKFYAFYQELSRLLDEGEPLCACIAERLLLSKRYPTKTDAKTLFDLRESLDIPCQDRRSFLSEYVKDAALSGSQMDLLIQKTNKIPIITVHQAKGCEFDCVILAGADNGHFPSYAAKLSGYEEEEKKIFYVAITRARERLVLTRALHNSGKHVDETPYFWALPEDCVRVNRAWKNGNE